MHAVSLFRSGKFDDAINAFIELDVNPAKVVALYPEIVAGRLSVKREKWITLFGGPAVEESPSDDGVKEHALERTSNLLDSLAASSPGTLRGRLKGIGALIPSGAGKDDDAVSISSKKIGLHHGAVVIVCHGHATTLTGLQMTFTVPWRRSCVI